MHRILFVDDEDIASMRGLRRVIHPARKAEENPLVVPDHPWEEQLILGGTVRWEPERGYRMWYQGYGRRTYLHLYAESEDGIHWTKPILGQYEDFDGSDRNNIFLSRLALRSEDRRPPATNQDHNPNVLYTPHLGPERTYTLISYDYARSGYAAYDGYFLAFSPDGLHWNDGPEEPVIPGHADVGWFTFDEQDGLFRGIVKNFLNIRGHRRRSVFCTESRDGYDWTLPKVAVLQDLEDEAWTEGRSGYHTQFYGMPIVRYESVLLGFLQMFRVIDTENPSHDGEIDIQLTCSRDGRRWTRVGDRRTILELGEPGAWDSGMVLIGNAMVLDGDEVRVYYSGADHTHAQRGSTQIGMAAWPRDRLVGLQASSEEGMLQTVLHSAGGHLHINAKAEDGDVAAELVGGDGQVIEGYEASACEVLRTDALDHVFRWRDVSSEVPEGAVAVRLHVRRAEAFSVWWE